MKNDLRDLLQERFAGHEASVDPGLWQAISGQLAAAAPAADGLGDLLKDRFKDHELEPDPGVWDGISQQLGHGAAAGSAAGGSGFGGWIAAGIAATALTGGLLFWTLSPDTTPTTPVAEVPSTPAPAPAPQGDQPSAVVTTPVAATPAATGTPANAIAAPAPASTQNAPATNAPQGDPAMDAPIDVRDREPDAPTRIETEKPGAHRAEVDRIIDRLIEQTINDPVVAQTESLPTAGLVPGQQPEELPGEVGDDDPNSTDGAVLPAADPVLWIPNAFSPGQRDGVNDELEVVAKGLTNVQVRIYSLDSRLVFRANDLHPWDGRDLGGQLCPQGYYFYAIEGLDGNDRTFSKGQTIYLFR